MAGPSAVVLLPDAWMPHELREFQAWLARSFSPDGGTDWWVLRDPRPLGLSELPRTSPMLAQVSRYAEDDVDETACLTHAAGFSPVSEIILAAMNNGEDDHRLLAELAVAIARRYGGMISLDGLLPAPPSVDGVAGDSMVRAARSRTMIMSLGGRWHEIPYRTAMGDVCSYHVVDADLLVSWLRHPHFRMVK